MAITFSLLPTNPLTAYHGVMEQQHISDEQNPQAQLHGKLREWRAKHPELTDQEWERAMTAMEDYLRLAWRVYRQEHKDEPLPDEL